MIKTVFVLIGILSTLTGYGQWVCGDSITVNHVAGTVAPITKSTKYGTIDSIAGELTKCWITKNLGADRQALSVSDTTEASAGWYWQFNTKQGFKHNGTSRTPAFTWTQHNREDADWQPQNDPCSNEISAEWRIPTSTEFVNIDNSGSWTNWNGPWGSDLKFHAGGWLKNTTGVIENKGVSGYYWSRAKASYTNAVYFTFTSSTSTASSNISKNYGFSIRCVKDFIPETTTCAGTPTVIHGGKTYNTVQIGTQCWLRENINIGTMVTGATEQTDNSIIEKYCYDNDTNNCNTYGGLYQWAEAVQYQGGVTNTTHWTVVPANVQGVCPTGWHVPTKTEYETLFTYLGITAGGKMKESGTTHWCIPNTGATNSSGFTAIPNGHLYNGVFEFIGKYGYHFSITKGSAANGAYCFGTTYNFNEKAGYQIYKHSGIAIRCIKD